MFQSNVFIFADLALQGDRREETREAGAEVVAGEEACPTKGL